jgi:hypothetical protein
MEFRDAIQDFNEQAITKQILLDLLKGFHYIQQFQ